MAQNTFLPPKHKELSLNSQHPHKKLGMMQIPCNPNTAEHTQVSPESSLVSQSSQ